MGIYVGNIKIKPSGISKAYMGETLIYQSGPENTFFYVEAINSCTITFSRSSYQTPTLYYSLNKTTWNAYTLKASISLNAGDRCYWKGNNSSFSVGPSGYIYLTATDNINVGGNIMSLLDETYQSKTIPETMFFCRLFYNCSKLISAKNLLLPATTLADSCYYEMFANCIALTAPPQLPATTLANYCYYRMFENCKSLTAPPQLPATTLANYCYYRMFANCIALTAPPQLPATTLANYCYYYMFRDCINLTSINNLPATFVNGYSYHSMYSKCSKIKISTTQTEEYTNEFRIPSTGTGSYYVYESVQYMFDGTGGSFTGYPTVNTTYYTSNSIV